MKLNAKIGAIFGTKIDKRFKYVYYAPMWDVILLLPVKNAESMYLGDMLLADLEFIGEL